MEDYVLNLVDAERSYDVHALDDGVAGLTNVIKHFPKGQRAVFVRKLADETLSFHQFGALKLENGALEHPETAFFPQVTRVARRQRIDRFQMPETIEVAVLGTVQLHQSASRQQPKAEKGGKGSEKDIFFHIIAHFLLLIIHYSLFKNSLFRHRQLTTVVVAENSSRIDAENPFHLPSFGQLVRGFEHTAEIVL